MEKILLPESIGYKANLHSHSTDSDGRFTPEEMKKHYIEHGYSILAYTDHLYMGDRTALNDENFVAISGYENNLLDWELEGSPTNGLDTGCYHLNFYSPNPNGGAMVGIDKRFYEHYNKNKTQDQKDICPLIHGFCEPTHSVDNANKIIAEAKELGYLVVYNHPVWSRHSAKDYLGLKGLCGMEMVNGGSLTGGYADDNEYIYDDMLRAEQRIACFANDDNHNLLGRTDDSFIGYNVMYPEKLNYESVFKCMQDGKSYASTGASIRGVVVKDGMVYVGAENAVYIKMTTNGRYVGMVRANDKPLTEAVFELFDNIYYFRITVMDINGKKAYTKAYFKDMNGNWN